ncbi:MAG: hypothetical protein NVSMB5_06810 [Candidatus Velthaea sp.]
MIVAAAIVATAAALQTTLATSDVHADIRLAPALVGPATLRVVLRDDRGKPIEGATVTAHVDMTTMEMDPGFKPLTRAPLGAYSRHLRLSMPGHYHVELRVARTGRKTETLDVPVFIDIP